MKEFLKEIRLHHLVTRKRGVVTLEATIIMPVVFLGIFGIILAVSLMFKTYNTYTAESKSLADNSRDWFLEKTLYEEYIYDYESFAKVEKKKEKIKSNSLVNLKPFLNIEPSQIIYNNYIFLKFLKNKDLNITRENTPISMFIRNINVTEYAVEDVMNFKNHEEEKKESKKVYVIDDNLDELEYNRIYHTHENCRYLKNKNPKVSTVADMRKKGFRPCMICLGM